MRENKFAVTVCMCNPIEGPVPETTTNPGANTILYKFASDIPGTNSTQEPVNTSSHRQGVSDHQSTTNNNACIATLSSHCPRLRNNKTPKSIKFQYT